MLNGSIGIGPDKPNAVKVLQSGILYSANPDGPASGGPVRMSDEVLVQQQYFLGTVIVSKSTVLCKVSAAHYVFKFLMKSA